MLYTWNLFVLYFWKVSPPKQGPKFQSKQGAPFGLLGTGWNTTQLFFRDYFTNHSEDPYIKHQVIQFRDLFIPDRWRKFTHPKKKGHKESFGMCFFFF